MRSADPYLRIHNLTKKFGDFTALSEISLEIFEGEFVCFLGPSGCGKTTLLRAIAGLDIQTFGEIEQNGSNVSSLPPAERDFGIVFQSYALFPNLTIQKNIAFGLENLKKSKAEVDSRVEELLALVGLSDQTDKYPAQLSGGQQQRVALARAIAISPGLLLLDEPLSALDAKVRGKLRHEIKDLQNRLGITTIMVTHDQEEALTMADRIVVINEGIIEQVGTPQEIYNAPETTFVADFIGSMNFLNGVRSNENKIEVGSQVFTVESDHWKADTEQNKNVVIAIRPEDIVVGAATENCIAASVDSVEFLGPFVRAELSSPALSGQTIQADFSANLVRRERLEVGSELQVSLPTKSIRMFSSASRAQ